MSFFARTLWSLALPTIIAGALITHPKDTEAKVNDSTYFNCSTSISTEYIHWHHGDKYVYTGDGIIEPYLRRFEMEINSSTGAYNLVIRSVRPEDAGEYICKDEGGTGVSHSAQLIVLDEVPSCFSKSKPTVVSDSETRGMESEALELVCTVAYRGNIPPVLEWKSAGENVAVPQEDSVIINAERRVTYSQVVKPSIEFQVKSYVCQTTRSAKNQYVCKLCNFKVNRMLYDESSSTKVSTTISLLRLLVVAFIQLSFK